MKLEVKVSWVLNPVERLHFNLAEDSLKPVQIEIGMHLGILSLFNIIK